MGRQSIGMESENIKIDKKLTKINPDYPIFKCLMDYHNDFGTHPDNYKDLMNYLDKQTDEFKKYYESRRRV